MTLIESLVKEGYANIEFEDFKESTGLGKRILLSATSEFDKWFSQYILATKDLMNLQKYGY
jgi:hypothetical protein